MQKNENKGKANWQKYQTYWESLSSHIKFWAKSMQHITPIRHYFHSECASCSYALWIKKISSLEQQKAPTHNPPSTAISNWAKVVAASVELMADNPYMPPPESVDLSNQLVQGVQILNLINF
ncbi:hypothetical protein VP01_1117g11 [Puccinia sorghi]|uniref:Uncharacterized protein n=1 Tax=Puccinia sorghi TaxID=27349 RepID=A0A0L6VSI1_9BASI|nr:hypothetical protein VP01_1117g11 [Puccinia sorghi]